jgi:hypothetical protein
MAFAFYRTPPLAQFAVSLRCSTLRQDYQIKGLSFKGFPRIWHREYFCAANT